MKERIKQHYHWVVLCLVFFEMIVFGGVINSFSIFIIPACESLGVTRGTFALATMPYTAATFLSTMFSGFFLKRWGYKRFAITSLLLAAVGQALMGTAQSLLVFGFSRILFALGYGACFTAGAVRITRSWFWKHQGLMIGLVTMGTGLGGSLMTVMLTAVIEATSWRVAGMVIAGLLLLVAGSYLLLKDTPEEMNLQAYGFGEQPKQTKRRTGRESLPWEGYSLKEQMKQPSFYLMAFCVLACCACVYMTTMVVVPHFQDLGYSPAEAAGYQSALMLTVAVAKLASGGLSDKLGAKVVTIGCVASAVIGQMLLSITADPILCYVGIMLMAIGLCMSSSVVPLLAVPLFGYRGSMVSNGIFLAMTAVANMISTPVSNFGYDLLGSYMPIFRVSAMVNFGILILFFVLFALAKKQRSRFLEQENHRPHA